MENTNIAVVTGANKGIGYAIVEQLLLHPTKYSVFLTSRDTQRGEEAMANLLKKYPEFKNRLHYHQLDVSSSKSIDNFVQWLEDNQKTVSLLVNNAGIFYQREIRPNNGNFEFVDFLPPEDTKRIIQTNVRGLIELTEKLLPYLADDGKIINISSLAGELWWQGEAVQNWLSDSRLTRQGFFDLLDTFEQAAYKQQHPALGYFGSIYFTSKAFVNAYTRFILPRLLKKNQTGFAVHPGWIQTDLGGKEAPGKIDDSYVSTLAIVNLSLEDSLKLSGRYFDEFGKLKDF